MNFVVFATLSFVSAKSSLTLSLGSQAKPGQEETGGSGSTEGGDDDDAEAAGTEGRSVLSLWLLSDRLGSLGASFHRLAADCEASTARAQALVTEAAM